MPRPKCLRRICHVPGVTYFKPAGIPLRMLEEVVVPLDEIEAIRLADFDGAYQERAAGEMRISRPTFSRLIESAHRKIADALLHGKAIRLEGGPVAMEGGDGMPAGDGWNAGPGRGMGPCGCGQARRARRGRGGAGHGGWGPRANGEGAAKAPAGREGTDQEMPHDNAKGGAK